MLKFLRPLFVMGGLLVIASQATFGQTDSLATIHFYSANPSNSSTEEFQLLHGNNSVLTITEGAEVIYQCKKGKHQFHFKGSDKTSVNLDVEAGGEYYVAYSLPAEGKRVVSSFGAAPSLVVKNAQEGKDELERIYREKEKRHK